MSRSEHPPTLLLITGVPGSGKSSLARAASETLGCAVIGHDWTMAGLRALPDLWTRLQDLEPLEFRTVGWSIMWSLARAQLRDGRSIVLDGVARSTEVEATRALAREVGVRCVVALTMLEDASVHRERIDGRRRDIPHWPELGWSSVQQSRSNFAPPADVDVVLNAVEPLEANVATLCAHLT